MRELETDITWYDLARAKASAADFTPSIPLLCAQPSRLPALLHDWCPLMLLQVKRGELNLRPKYQRGLVWSKEMSSRVVVTVAENRMIPTIYIEEGGSLVLHLMNYHGLQFAPALSMAGLHLADTHCNSP